MEILRRLLTEHFMEFHAEPARHGEKTGVKKITLGEIRY